MLRHSISARPTQVQRARTIARWLTSGGAVVIQLLAVACGSSSGTDGGSGSATLSGRIEAAGTSATLEGATISVGTQQATSDANGHFELTGLAEGAATIRAARPGYTATTVMVTLSAGANMHDFTLTVEEVYVSDVNAMYVPAGVGPIRAVIILLGGPFTKGFVTGDPIAPPGYPTVEQSLQALGVSLRTLAKGSHLALFGTQTIAMPDLAGSDNGIFATIDSVAALSAHPEMAAAPVLLVGIGDGGQEAAGLVSRNPDRVIGLLERKPNGVATLTGPVTLAVPTLVVQGELDQEVNNGPVLSVFLANRSRGGLWALVVMPGAGHAEDSAPLNTATIDWISQVLTRRLPTTSGDPLITLDQTSGWLGNQATLEIAPWASYSGDRTTASWLLSQSAATSWQGLGETPEPPPSTIRVHR
ncbi:MAG: carboxypeptidase regulatory-like domain-containing protein [Gemmatimonadales bacterium]